MGIPADTIEQVRLRASLAELTAGLPKFRRSGKGFTACCPFHEDDNPSFSINDEDGLYYCFACGAKGSLFDYVMKTQNLSFPETIKWLGARVGIAVEETKRSPSEREREKAQSDRRRHLREMSREAWLVYREELMHSSSASAARGYLHKRGVSSELQAAFGLGFAPQAWDFLLPKLTEKLCQGEKPRFTAEDLKSGLLELGLLKLKRSENTAKVAEQAAAGTENAKPTDRRDYYDAFRDRVIFPITRSDGAPVAFGGRTITNLTDAPKYINSSESPIYQKRRTFFGLSQALPAVRKADAVYLVEGYLDVLSMHHRGFGNTIAGCGTAVAEEHVSLLKRIASRVFLLFDGDSAGRKAASRCFELFLNSGIEVKAVMLPEGHDPDSLAHSATKEQMAQLFEKAARPVFESYFDALLTATGDGAASDPVQLGKVAEKSAGILAGIHNPVERERLARYAAERLGVGLASYMELMSSRNASRTFSRAPAPAPQARAPQHRGQKQEQSREKPSNLHVNSKKKSASFSYWEQLLVALICEPKLASRVLKMPLLLSGGQVSDEMPDDVHGCIRALADCSLSGLASVETAAEKQQLALQLTEILEHWGLDARALLAQAERQLMVGGTKPENVVEDLGLTASRTCIKSEMEMLRSSEAQASNAESLADIVQRKLEARRSLDRLNLTDRYSKEDSG